MRAIGGISETIRKIAETASAIAASVVEQAKATQEIVGSVAEASRDTNEVTSHIGGVARDAETTGAVANEILSASSELTKRIGEMRREMRRFLDEVRAAA